ncbi:MAG: protein kinase [Pseudomonadota bacterium]
MSSGSSGYAEQRIGTTLKGKYRLERMIGVGGMAAVYQAEHRNGNRVAIKLLHPEIAAQPELRSRFLREGYVANKVAHPGAVRVLDDDIAEDGSVFLVMELLEGQTLDQRSELNGGRLAMREVCELCFKLLEVLAAAHNKGVVHRDIKPDNVFLTTDGLVKVLDFGIARLNDAAGGASATRTGNMMGTPAFMAPEQALGRSKQIDAQSDLFSVGATMFTLASGRYVHEGETGEEILVYTASRQARSVLTVAPELPQPLAWVIDRALRYEKAERWPDASSMAGALADGYRAVFGGTLTGVRPSLVAAVAAMPATTMMSAQPSQYSTNAGPAAHAGTPSQYGPPPAYGHSPSQHRASSAPNYGTGPMQSFTAEQAPSTVRAENLSNNPATVFGAPSAYGPAAGSNAPPPGTFAAAGTQAAPAYAGRGTPAPGATTTASVVSNQAPLVPRYVGGPARRKQNSKLTLPLLIAGVAVLAIITLVLALRGSSSEQASAGPGGDALPTAFASAQPETVLTAAAPPTPTAVQPVADPSPPVLVPVERAAPAPAPAPAPRRTTQQRAPREEDDEPAAPPAPPPPPPRVLIDCSVPTYFDANGIKRFKPGCN